MSEIRHANSNIFVKAGMQTSEISHQTVPTKTELQALWGFFQFDGAQYAPEPTPLSELESLMNEINLFLARLHSLGYDALNHDRSSIADWNTLVKAAQQELQVMRNYREAFNQGVFDGTLEEYVQSLGASTEYTLSTGVIFSTFEAREELNAWLNTKANRRLFPQLVAATEMRTGGYSDFVTAVNLHREATQKVLTQGVTYGVALQQLEVEYQLEPGMGPQIMEYLKEESFRRYLSEPQGKAALEDGPLRGIFPDGYATLDFLSIDILPKEAYEDMLESFSLPPYIEKREVVDLMGTELVILHGPDITTEDMSTLLWVGPAKVDDPSPEIAGTSLLLGAVLLFFYLIVRNGKRFRLRTG